MKWFKNTTKANNILQKFLYGGKNFGKTENRNYSKINKRPSIIQNFISGLILLNKNMVKFLGCYTL